MIVEARVGLRAARVERTVERFRFPRSPAMVRASRLLSLGLLLCCACAGEAGERRAAPGPDNIVLVTLDTTRRDAIDCYSGRTGLTPALAELAAESLVFDRARTVTPVTLPAHASVFTGLYPPRHGVRDNGAMALPSSASTLAERMQAAGFETAAIVGAIVLDRRFGLDQGFAVYDQPDSGGSEGGERFHYRDRPAAEVTRRASAWLADRDRNKPFFLWVHYFDPHQPYDLIPEFERRADGHPYLAEVAAMDAALGELFDTLRREALWDTTVVAVVADHGEGLGEHAEATHGGFCYDTTLRVPLLLRDPARLRAGERSQDIVSVVDLFPTLLEAVGLEPEAGIDGRSLYGARSREDQGVYFESYYGYLHYGWSPLSGWVDGSAKYVHSSSPELYRTSRDAGEHTNLLDREPETAARHRAAIARIASLPALEPDGGRVDDGLRDSLASLGYASGGRSASALPGPLETEGLPSPRERAGELEELERAKRLLAGGETAPAVALLSEIVAQNPLNAEALKHLSTALFDEGRFADAAVHLRRLVDLGDDRAETHERLAISLLRSGDPQGALEHFERAHELEPQSREAVENLIILLDTIGRPKRAAHYRKALESMPADG